MCDCDSDPGNITFRFLLTIIVDSFSRSQLYEEA